MVIGEYIGHCVSQQLEHGIRRRRRAEACSYMPHDELFEHDSLGNCNSPCSGVYGMSMQIKPNTMQKDISSIETLHTWFFTHADGDSCQRCWPASQTGQQELRCWVEQCQCQLEFHPQRLTKWYTRARNSLWPEVRVWNRVVHILPVTTYSLYMCTHSFPRIPCTRCGRVL